MYQPFTSPSGFQQQGAGPVARLALPMQYVSASTP